MSDDRDRFGDFDDGRRGGRRDGGGRDYTYSSARDYAATGRGDRDDRNFRGGGTGYAGGPFRGGQDDHRSGGERYRSYDHDGQPFTERGGREEYSRTGSWGGNQDWQREQDRGGRDRDRESGYGNRFGGSGAGSGGGGSWFSGDGRGESQRQHRPVHGQRAGQGHDDRGFFDRAGDEVRSWFGDEEAERRRRFDQRQDEAMGGTGHASARDEHYHNWRREQIEQLDRDYDEYRREHGTKFRNEFGTWRSERQTQRDCLNRVNEHMEVIGADGQHVGTVDKVQGDRILLTKNDVDAGGRHHSIPSRWIDRVEDKVMIRKTADEAKREWRDEERNSAFFGDDGMAQTSDTRRANERDTARGIHARQDREAGKHDGDVDLNRSFSGTYDKR
jgi:hypothetical protein